MGDIQTRPFSKNYSGLVNQSVIAIGITVLCVTGQELMKRRRRGARHDEGLGSRESWEFGYLYQGRSWAKNPSPPSPAGWPLLWVKQAIEFPEAKLLELRGIDAALYIRFLRGCFWFTLLHTFTTFPILFPIHLEFSEDTVSPKSMTRASISSLVTTAKGLSLLWIHICLLFWVTLTWMATLLWMCTGAFQLRAASLKAASKRVTPPNSTEVDTQYYRHPHPQYGFADIPVPDHNHPNTGLRLRTIMVSNVPHQLRNEKLLKEYFEFYMSRKLEKPSMGITSSTQPGFLNKSFAFLFNRAKRIPGHLPPNPLMPHSDKPRDSSNGKEAANPAADAHNPDSIPVIERVVIARKMSELASLLERREEILRLLETAHIKLANKALFAVKTAMDRKVANKPLDSGNTRATEIARQRRSLVVDPECGEPQDGTLSERVRTDQLIEALGPFVEEFGLQDSLATRSKKALSASSKYAFRQLRTHGSEDSDGTEQMTPTTSAYPPSPPPEKQSHQGKTIWEALYNLPRNSLDAYQPLVNLSHFFRGKTVPSIDYYTAKLNLLSSLVTENRSKAVSDYDAVSTAFVTFADPADARRACKYLAVHPNNPLACLVTMAPMYQDLDWIRVMKSSFNAEFVKDWVVNMGVWGFTLFWLFPVSLLVGLVSIQNISLFWPSLKAYLDRHAWEEEVIQSFLPTLLVSLLALLIPLILLLIAKKAHTITTLSALHDKIMTRYYKFLIVNVLVFFCVGTAALQSFLESFRSTTRPDVLKIVADSFPTAGPFYVGWLIFTNAIHGGFEIALFGLPLIMYPNTTRQVTPRKRAVGIRPRTFNFYYWLPNHLLVLHVLLLFSVLNPFVLPFGTLYFFIQAGVVKNQLIHVYAKHYEANGQTILIRIVRYSLDGLILAQAVFLAYMIVLKKSVNVGLAVFLIILTAITKLLLTRMCRAQFESDDIAEAEIMCGRGSGGEPESLMGDADMPMEDSDHSGTGLIQMRHRHSSIFTWRLPAWVSFSYSTVRHRPHHHPRRRQPNPFGPQGQSFSRLNSVSHDMCKNVQSSMSVARKSTSNPIYHETPWGGISKHEPITDKLILHNIEASCPVVSHPPPISWDDQTTADLPYDNPFYTRAFANVLWLPRNPCGILDLDDTIDLKTSLTVEVAAGKLGTWLGLGESASPEEIPQDGDPVSSFSEQRLNVATTSLSPVDGTEEIDLPVIISKRIQSKEDGVEQTLRPRRPSTYRRKISGGDKSSLGAGSGHERRRPSILGDSSLPLSFRSFSDGNGQVQGRGRSGSTMSALQLPPYLYRSQSSSQKSVLRPDRHAQADLVAANGSRSQVSVMSRTQNVSAREAIFHEVLAEEQAALVDRIEDEQAEAQKATPARSWLTSWMFKKLD